VHTIFEVHPQVKKVYASCTDALDKRHQVFVGHFVWDVLDHHRRAHILPVFNPGDIQVIVHLLFTRFMRRCRAVLQLVLRYLR